MRKLLSILAVVAFACSAQAQILILKAGADGVVFEPSTVIFPALRLSGTLVPNANDGAALGTTALGFADLFLASGGTMHFANTDWVATHTTGILTVGTGDLRVTTAGTNTASVVTVGGTQTLAAKTLTTPVIGAATGTSLAVSGALTSSSPSAKIGYATGAGGAVTQGTNRTTTVVMVPNPCTSGAITTTADSIAALGLATFTVTDSAVAATDVVVISKNGGDVDTFAWVNSVGAGSFTVTLRNSHATDADTTAFVLNFAVIKAVAN